MLSVKHEWMKNMYIISFLMTNYWYLLLRKFPKPPNEPNIVRNVFNEQIFQLSDSLSYVLIERHAKGLKIRKTIFHERRALWSLLRTPFMWKVKNPPIPPPPKQVLVHWKGVKSFGTNPSSNIYIMRNFFQLVKNYPWWNCLTQLILANF
jgi:hypothetical protein